MDDFINDKTIIIILLSSFHIKMPIGNLLVLAILLSVFASNYAQNLCYRCFGSNWCNNFTDPNFINNVHLIDCPATSKAFNYEGLNPTISRTLKNFEEASNRIQKDVAPSETTWGCVTATLHEAHEVHTIRTCLNNAATICSLVHNVILNPNVNDIGPEVYLDCEGCTDFLCNSHIFIKSEEKTEAPPITTNNTTTVATASTLANPPNSSEVSSLSSSETSTESLPATTPGGNGNVAMVSLVAIVLAIFANIFMF